MKDFNYLCKTIKIIWKFYGGFKALMKSPFFYSAIIITTLSYNQWITENWWDTVLDIIPSLLGFSLGGYAILVAFGDEKFISLISGATKRGRSPYMGLSSNFVIFISFQIIALLSALIYKACYLPMPEPIENLLDYTGISINSFVFITRVIFWGFGYFFFIYAIVQTLAATLQIFQLTRWRDRYLQINSEINNSNNKSEE